MRERVRRLAHDLSELTYVDADVDYALQDAFEELLDRILAEPAAMPALLSATTGAEPEDPDAMELPTDCLRLLKVQARATGATYWQDLQQLGQEVAGLLPEDASDRTATWAALGLSERIAPPGCLSVALGYLVEPEGGETLALVPEGLTGVEVRMVYLAKPTWPTAARDAVELPDGADEILELLAADKLTADEPRDDKRMAIYRSRIEARWQRWTMGRARGLVPRGQEVAGVI
jgi:hypothetical protein